MQNRPCFPTSTPAIPHPGHQHRLTSSLTLPARRRADGSQSLQGPPGQRPCIGPSPPPPAPALCPLGPHCSLSCLRPLYSPCPTPSRRQPPHSVQRHLLSEAFPDHFPAAHPHLPALLHFTFPLPLRHIVYFTTPAATRGQEHLVCPISKSLRWQWSPLQLCDLDQVP